MPRPYDGLPRIWHGSATSRHSPELAARHGDPLFTANAIQPRAAYAELVAYYRERYAAHGHDPSGGPRRRRFRRAAHRGLRTAQAVARYKDLYEARVAQTFKPHLAGRAGYNTPFRTLEDAIAHGPQLIGSPQQIIDKILGFHEVYRLDLQSVTVDGFGLGHAEQLETLQRFAEEIAPVVRREAPSTLWDPPGELTCRKVTVSGHCDDAPDGDRGGPRSPTGLADGATEVAACGEVGGLVGGAAGRSAADGGGDGAAGRLRGSRRAGGDHPRAGRALAGPRLGRRAGDASDVAALRPARPGRPEYAICTSMPGRWSTTAACPRRPAPPIRARGG